MPVAIPEEAIDAMPDLSGAAFKVFCYLCRLRNTRTGISRCTLRAISTDCGVNYGYVATVLAELVEAGWIGKKDGEGFEIFKGFEGSKNSNGGTENSNMGCEKIEPESPYISNIDIYNISLEETNKDSTNRLIDTSKRKTRKGSKNSNGKKGTRLPTDFTVTSEMLAWVEEKALNVNVALETEKFCNYYAAKTGANATKLDWERTWKNWIINANEYGKVTTGRIERRSTAEKLNDYAEIFAKYE